MEHYDLWDLSHNPELARALGDMVVIWARAESGLAFVLAEVTGMDVNMAQHGYYRIPTFEARVKFILALIEEWGVPEPRRKAFTTAVSKLAGLADARNRWVHGIWCIERPANTTVTFHLRAAPQKGRRLPVKVADVRNHVQAVRNRVEELRRLTPNAPWT